MTTTTGTQTASGVSAGGTRPAFASSIGRKAVVAGTGLGLVGFLLAHMLGNLKAYEGREAVNEYAELLRFEPALLWAARAGLIVFAIAHVVASVQLTAENRRARPRRYRVNRTLRATLASRGMIWGGLALLFFVVYHLLHFTTRSVHLDLVGNTYVAGGHIHPDVFENVVRSFRVPSIAAVYVLAQVALFFHLSHGIQSAFRTLGMTNPRHLTIARAAGLGAAAIIVGGFLSLPIGVLAGIIR